MRSFTGVDQADRGVCCVRMNRLPACTPATPRCSSAIRPDARLRSSRKRHALNPPLHRRRARLEETLARAGRLHTLSLARWRLHASLSRAVARHATGRCLDAGSGRSPYRALLAEYGSDVTSVDIEDRSGDVDLLVDVQAMPEVASGSFETALCTQVLEHLPRPWDALAELTRVLAPGGTLILTVPHLSVMHEVPHDYYRFTEFGLRALCEDAGLEVIEIEATGGIFTFLGHGASGLIMSTLGTLPLLHWPIWLLNYAVLVRLLGLVDRALGMPRLYPCDHLVVARKVDTGASRNG